ncbi:hypothetical protein LIER_35551 [Lithospermum erythrorhizon]|uniref:Uncharacterized protein n=1 Tax=Lithospermum erythrorhizon TaxID=34254 RepID=A0AAV3NTN7_LITER
MFMLGGDWSLFPKGRLIQKISSVAQLLPFQSLPKLLDPSLIFRDGYSFCLCRTALTPWQALTCFPSLTGEQILYYLLFAVDRTVRRRTYLSLWEQSP